MDDQDKTDVYPPCSPRLCAKSGTDQQKQPKKMMKQEELVEGKCCRVYSIISPVKLWFPSQLSLGFSTLRSPELWMQQLMAWAPIYGTCRACWERFPKTGLPRVIIFWDP